MRLILQLRPLTDTGHPMGDSLQSGISLPRGCGIDVATAEIQKAGEAFKTIAIELFRAETEGREPKLDLE